MERKYFIYLYSFPNGKYYVGQTFEGSNRFGKISRYKGQMVYNAMIKYPDFKKEIIKADLTIDEVDYWESYYIKHYQSMNRDYGYNLESGGNKNKTVSIEVKKKISEKLKGMFSGDKHPRYGTHHTEEELEKISKKICQYDLNGNFIQEFKSIKDAEKKLKISSSTISQNCLGKTYSCFNYKFKFKNDVLDENGNIKNKIEIEKFIHHSSKKVYQYDLEGNFINFYNSLKEASEETDTDISNISLCCLNKARTANDFIWKYIEDIKDENGDIKKKIEIDTRNPGSSKICILKNLETNEEKEFLSFRDMGIYLGYKDGSALKYYVNKDKICKNKYKIYTK